MIKLKSIFKGILKFPVSSGLNILSLIIAFSGIMTLLLYVSYEHSFDKFNKNYKSIYQLQVRINKLKYANEPALMSGIIDKNVPGVEDITPLWFANFNASTEKLKKQNTNYNVNVLYADNSIFNIFTLPFLVGNKNAALTQPNTVVLTKALASKLFGNTNPVGKTVWVNKGKYTVTGIIRNIPKTSSFTADCITSFKTLTQDPNNPANRWDEWSYFIFCKISPKTNAKNVVRNINHIAELKKHITADNSGKVRLIPLSKLHYTNHLGHFQSVNKTVLNILVLLAIILAVMGIINFVNLSVSQAGEKAKRYSIMRVLGAGRGIIIAQVLLESILISLIALVFAFVVHSIIYQPIQNLFDIRGLGFGNRATWYLYFVILAIVFGIVAGSYPSIVISSTTILSSSKGSSKFLKRGRNVRNTLFVLQFVFSIALLISSVGIAKQIRYWKNYNTGINKKSVIFINTTPNIRTHYKAFAREIMADSNIVQYTYSQFRPGNVGMTWGREINGKYKTLYCWPVDNHFLKFFGIKIVKGRPFSQTPGADHHTFIINQKGAQKMGWKNPLGKTLAAGITDFGFSSGPIIGVAKDFNFASLEKPIQPMIFLLTNDRKEELLLRLKPGHYTEAISHVRRIWRQFEPEQAFNYQFLNEALNKLYLNDKRIASFINFIALWTILLSLTGLLGIVIFTTRLRTKEIGIRKVNGATVLEIVVLLIKEFAKWVGIAFVLATPVAYYALHMWLQNFAYKTSLSWWVFILAGLGIMLIAMGTVSWQTFTAARRNPVESLRYE